MAATTGVLQGPNRSARLTGLEPPAGWKLERGDLSTSAPDAELLGERSYLDHLAAGWIPVRRPAEGRVLVATAVQPDRAVRAEIAARHGDRVDLVAVSGWDLKNALLSVRGSEIADAAANTLYRRNPQLSARTVLSRRQTVILWAFIAVTVVSLILWPVTVLIGLLAAASIVFLTGTAFKFFVALRGARYDVVEQVRRDEVAALDDEVLPTYTVLVPVFREANIVAQLVGNLGELDWPTDRLEVLILIEEEDHETRGALAEADPPAHFHVVTVPKGQPQTKPRACNVGLQFATGDYLVIYDAEDTPDPDQLKKAFIAFERGGEQTVCVQAALNYFNADENALTRMFTLEYSYWFDYMLPGLDSAALPIPLGGTSNHFRVAALRELGGWDPYNVTEDADLGIRASALGYRVGVINSTTMEEANTSIPNFVRQRSRWIKGYMQSTLVHARSPMTLIRTIGPVKFLSFLVLVGFTPLTFLAMIPFTIVTVFTLLWPTVFLDPLFPLWLLWLCLVNFLIGNALMIYLCMMGPYKRASFGLMGWTLLNPVYWLLHSWASYKGLWQLVTKPHYWEKTEHGLTTHTNEGRETAA